LEQKNAKWFLAATRSAASTRLVFIGADLGIIDRSTRKPITVKRPAKTGPGWKPEECSRVLDWVRAFKLQLMRDGVLCFDDAYALADHYFQIQPRIAAILQCRFPLVFVDEMQDMAAHQYGLLERLFAAPGCAYQRIGDRNQSIHGERNFSDEDNWKPRNPTLTLNKSLRLSPPVAAVVSRFALHDPNLNIVGTNTSALKPKMLVYQDATATAVLERFSSIVRSEIDAGNIPLDHRSKFRAIAWNTTWSEDAKPAGKLRLVDFCPQYRPNPTAGRVDPRSLEATLREGLRPASSMLARETVLLTVLLSALRLQRIRNPVFDTHFTRASLMAHLRETHPEYYATLCLRRLRWCLDSINVGIDAVIADVRHHLPEFLAQFGAKLKEANDYVFAPPAAVPEPAIAAEGNVVRWHGFDIELASVHAVKGQTHTATLYFETAYHADGKGPAAKSYESQRLASQFLGQPFGASVPTRVQQSAKMVYVGFSRPTHLLCFAVHKQRFNAGLAAVAGNAWEVVDLG
jgi:hypothetical protein